MLNRAREWWEGLGRSNQIMLVATSFAVIVALVGFIAWASTPEYVLLYSNLSAQDAGAITDKLHEAGVPYHTTGGGKSIEVPEQKREEMHMIMARVGLPTESTATLGYEVLKDTNIGQTSTMEGQTILRAHEGEIAKSIMTIGQVANAVVHIAPADDSPFITEKSPARASVVLTLRPGQTLDDENIRAIVRLTQMSYSGLNEDKISIVDSHGSLLHDPLHTVDGSNDRHKEEIALAQAKRTEFQAALDRTIGPNKAFVIVNTELNSDKQHTETTEVTPGATTDKKTETEKMDGGAPQGGGGLPPGVGANAGANPPGIPDYAKNNTQNGGSFVHETSSVTTMPTVVKTQVDKASGTVDKLTVSVLVDTKVPAEQIPAIKEILMTSIAATASNNATRLVTVAQVPFDHTAEEADAKAAAAASNSENMTRMLTALVPLALMVVALFLLYRALRKPQMRYVRDQLALAGGSSNGGQFSLDGGGMAFGPDGMPVPGQNVENLLNSGEPIPIGISAGSNEPRTFEIIEEAFDAHLESIQHLVKTKPDTVAALIKAWTTEDK